MKASINNVNANPPLSTTLPYSSKITYTPNSQFNETTSQNQFINNSNAGLDYLTPPNTINNGNNPNYNIVLNSVVSNPNFIPVKTNPVNCVYTIPQSQINNSPINSPSSTYNTFAGSKMSRSKFTPQEDATLKELVAKYGSSKWSEIAMKLPNRTGRQCRERWKNYLAPGIQNGPWTPEEDALLAQKVKELGTMWSKMVSFFPGRTDVNLKNRWVTLRYKKSSMKNAEDNEEHIEEKIENEEREEPEEVATATNNNAPVYQNNYYPYYQIPAYPVNITPVHTYFTSPIEYRPQNLRLYSGNSVTIKQGPDYDPNRDMRNYMDIGTETEKSNSGNISPILNKNSRPTLEPSIILSQPRWLLNHRPSESNSQNSIPKIKINPSSFQQNQPGNRFEVPLLVTMPLGTSS